MNEDNTHFGHMTQGDQAGDDVYWLAFPEGPEEVHWRAMQPSWEQVALSSFESCKLQ